MSIKHHENLEPSYKNGNIINFTELLHSNLEKDPNFTSNKCIKLESKGRKGYLLYAITRKDPTN